MTARTLVLVRHAKAEPWSSAGDRGRALTEQGADQAARLGRLLTPALPRVDLALVSGARRTRQTLEALARSVRVARAGVIDELYGCAPDTVIDLVRSLEGEPASVIVVGHEPTVSRTAWTLAGCGRERDTVAAGVPTATAVLLRFEGDWSQLSERSCSLDVVSAPLFPH